MGKLVVGGTRFLPLYALGLVLTLLVPTKTLAFGESISVSPSSGPTGQAVTIVGTGWHEHAIRGIDVPIWIGFANVVGHGLPDANGNFSVGITIPVNPPPQEIVNGRLRISAIIGNGGSADAFYAIGQSSLPSPPPSTLPPPPVALPPPPPPPSAPPGQPSLPPGLSPQHPPLPPTPGWYGNSVPSRIYEDSSGLAIMWADSYIYQHPGIDNLYWYAEVIYLNESSHPLTISCVGRADQSLAKEHIRGTEGLPPGASGSVAAEETFCSRNPTFTASLESGDTHYEWAIFHNVPPGGEVRLEWGSYGFSPWVDPWYFAYPSDVPPPTECPRELVTLGTCHEEPPVPPPPVPMPVPTPTPPPSGQQLSGISPIVLNGILCGAALVTKIPDKSRVGQFKVVGFIRNPAEVVDKIGNVLGITAVVEDLSGNKLQLPLDVVRLIPTENCVEVIVELLAPGQLGALEQCLAASTPEEQACLQNILGQINLGLEKIGLGAPTQEVIPPGVTPPTPVPTPTPLRP